MKDKDTHLLEEAYSKINSNKKKNTIPWNVDDYKAIAKRDSTTPDKIQKRKVQEGDEAIPQGHIGQLAQTGIEELGEPNPSQEDLHNTDSLLLYYSLVELFSLIKTLRDKHEEVAIMGNEDKFTLLLNSFVDEENVKQLIKQLDAVFNRINNYESN